MTPHQLDLLDMVRPTDPETSHRAARTTNRQGGKDKVLGFLRLHRGQAFTDHEIAAALNMDKGSATKRRLECQRDGDVEFSGEWGLSPNGCDARKWRAT